MHIAIFSQEPDTMTPGVHGMSYGNHAGISLGPCVFGSTYLTLKVTPPTCSLYGKTVTKLSTLQWSAVIMQSNLWRYYTWCFMTTTERKSDLELTTYTSYLRGELWGIDYEKFEENWPRCNGTALCLIWQAMEMEKKNLKYWLSCESLITFF